MVIMWFSFGGVFFFISVLGMGSVILLWHSLCLSYNYYGEEEISNLKRLGDDFQLSVIAYCQIIPQALDVWTDIFLYVFF